MATAPQHRQAAHRTRPWPACAGNELSALDRPHLHSRDTEEPAAQATSAQASVQMKKGEDPLHLVRLMPLMNLTKGRPEIAIGLIDGPLVRDHPGLAGDGIREIPG